MKFILGLKLGMAQVVDEAVASSSPFANAQVVDEAVASSSPFAFSYQGVDVETC